ncbi:MAG: 16S rRNA (guanine(966)-N(2))-methyltransferase RsmD [Proteobacteria bacterium]|nr:16S rRNA (guanine(966)-N(2))-methyltransferase RsmD [Pseudomonadota bacterium]
MVPGKVRIIGGKWRGRSIKVVDIPGLRPTPDRVRETLFNWLAPYIVNARCLDLFAGSGALGFEALSRGAKEVVFIDKYPPIVASLANIASELNAKAQCDIVRASAVSFITTHQTVIPFDIIFLDPPFASPLLQQSIEALAKSQFVKMGTLLYLESPKALNENDIPSTWQVLKAKVAGEVAYHLVKVESV